jgi:two-component system cell cycle response regulator DivK
MRILYVEDNEVNRALVERVVRARRCDMVFRDEGEGALEVLAADPTIDLILLDIELAGAISGLDVTRTLRERHDTRPVVAITAYAMAGDRERILSAGCDQYLPKPLAIADLLNLLDHYQTELAQKSAQPEPAATEAAPAAAGAPSAPPPSAAVVPVPAPEPATAADDPSPKPAAPSSSPGTLAIAPEPAAAADDPSPKPAPPSSSPGTSAIAAEAGQPSRDGRTPQGSQPT